MSIGAPAAGAGVWLRAMPALFVLIWSTGFVVARLAMPHAPPMGFLAVRFALSIVGFGAWIVLARGVAWPRSPQQVAHLGVLGALQHAGYLGGVWAAVKLGMPAGLAALIVCLQPMLTAAWLSWRGTTHHVSARQWFGLWLGIAGLTLVLWRRMQGGELSAASLALAVGALISITIGPCTAVMAWIGFGEGITPSMWLGMGLCAAAVLLVRRG